MEKKVTYCQASIAVDTLLEQYNYQHLVKFQCRLVQDEPEAAFEEIFGKSIVEFETEINFKTN